MEAFRKALVIFMTVTMMFFGTSLDSFGALSFAAEEPEDAVVNQETADEELAADSETQQDDTDATINKEEGEETDDAADEETDPDLIYQTLKANKVRLEGLMPEDAKLAATDASDSKAVKKLESEDETTLAAYDITIKADGAEYQPDSDNPILVQINDKDIKADSNLSIWHLRDDGTKEQIEDFAVSKGKVTFEATGFSVYVIVEGPESYVLGNLSDLEDAASSSEALFLSVTRSVTGGQETDYFTNTLNGNKAIIPTTDIMEAKEWFVEAVPNQTNQYYLYTNASGGKKYLSQNGSSSSNEIKLTDNPVNAFLASTPESGKFLFKLVSTTNKWLQYSGSGSGFRLYQQASDAGNTRITLTKASSVPMSDDQYHLGGSTYGLMYRNSSTSGYGMLFESNTNGTLKGMSMFVRNDPMDQSNILYIAKDSNIPMWTFTCIEKDQYYLSADINGVKKYLCIADGAGGPSCVDTLDDYCTLQVIPGAGDNAGKIRLVGVKTQKAIEFNGNNFRVVNASSSVGDKQWLNLADYSVYTEEDFVSYSAAKTSVCDVNDGQQIIIYTRVWNDDKSQYEFYAIDHNGDMMPCYESGDVITWIGTRNNTILWDFTVNYQPGSTNPNNYYELQNDYTGEYIMPIIGEGGTPGQIFSLDPGRGVNLNGRRDGEYSTTILAWDDAHYDYAGLKVENGKLVSCPMAESAEFYFALFEDNPPALKEVETVNNRDYGITMKMVKFDDTDVVPESGKNTSPTSREQYDVMGTQTYSEGQAQPGLLSKELESNGYPLVNNQLTQTQISLERLFARAQDPEVEVNHLFIKSIYQSSGYFQYDSTQNFASLLDQNSGVRENQFKVYQQLCKVDGNADTRKHGQFMPYNRLDTSNKAGENVTNIYGNQLSENDPRKYEDLYGFIEGKNNEHHYFGMELEGGFVQTPSGKDAWGHDIIFEFVGDDDFWLYVDGELVIDLGGIHKALGGSVNYSTGKVVVNGHETSLYEIFETNYSESNPQASPADIQAYLDGIFQTKTVGNNTCHVFKDYSAHNVRIFYMERGAGASNLRMRFNMATITPGQVQLTKEVTGSDKHDYADAKFPYQILYYDETSGDYVPLELQQDSHDQWNVVYVGTDDPVDYISEAQFEGGNVSYQNVFFLKPGETAAINFLDNDVRYKIVECYVDTNIYNIVQANGETISESAVTGSSQSNRKDFESVDATVKQRTKIIYGNHIDQQQLKSLIIKKRLFDHEGNELTTADDSSTFTMRVSLGKETVDFDNLPYYGLGEYYVKDGNSQNFDDCYYCKWDSSAHKFVRTNYKTYSELIAHVGQEYTIGQVAFQTSLSGAISEIPAGYSIEIRNLLPGTKYKVVEEDYDNPIGYGKREWNDNGKTYNGFIRVNGDVASGEDENMGVVRSLNPTIEVHNQKGYGIRANKVWSDAGIMLSHDNVFFAVFIDESNTPVQDSVHSVGVYGNTTWYFSELEPGTTLANYKVFEVKEQDDGQGNKTYIKVTGSEHIRLDGVAADHSPVRNLEYFATYKRGTDTQGRTDTVTNTRVGGLEVDLKDFDGNPLTGGRFELRNEQGELAGTFSASDGLVSMMYFADGVYTLTEAKTPAGMQAPTTVFTITVSNEGAEFNVTVPEDNGGWSYDSTEKLLTINNKPFTLAVKKVDESNQPLAGAHFALYKQITGSSGLRPDYYPFPNYEDLVSNDQGIITNSNSDYQIDQTLTPGTYYLTETQTPDGYVSPGKDVLFTLSPNGFVSIDTDTTKYTGNLTENSTQHSVSYEISITNLGNTPIVAPTGFVNNMWPLIWILILGLFLYTAMTYMRRRRGIEAFAMEAANAEGYEEFEYYDDADAFEDSEATMDFAADEVAENIVSEVQSEPSEDVYEAFDWTRITI